MPNFPLIKLKNTHSEIRIKIHKISVITLFFKPQTEWFNFALSMISNCVTGHQKVIFLTASESS